LVGNLVAEVARTITVLFWRHSTAGGLLASTLTCGRHKLKCSAEGQGLHQERRIRISGCHPHKGENAARAVLSNGPVGPGPRAPKASGAPKQPMR